MPAQVIADAVTDLPEGLRPAAKEVDGKFVVEALPEGWGIDNVGALRGKLTKAETDAKRQAERLRGFAIDDKGTLLEPDAFKAVLDEHRALKEAQGKAPDIEKLRKQYADEAERTWSQKHAAEAKRATELDSQLDRAILSAEIDRLVAEMGPKDGKADLIRMLLADKLGVDKRDGKRTVRVRSGEDWLAGNGPDGYAPTKEWALGSVRTQHADLFRGDGESGAGATSTSSTRNPAVVRLSREELNGNAAKVMAAHDAAVKAGKRVEWV